MLTGTTSVVTEEAAAFEGEPGFIVDENAIDPAVFGLSSYAAPTAPAPRIARRSAMQVPAVKRARDLIAGTLGGLPLDVFNAEREPSSLALFEQPEANVPRSVTMTRLFEDLLFEGRAWWRVVEFGWDDYPTKVRRIPPRNVILDEITGQVWVEGHRVPDRELIRFDSPTDGVLIAGARAIRTCLNLDSAASNYADGTPPVDYFTPAEGADPADDDTIKGILQDWQVARRGSSTGYVPAALKYNTGGWSPKDLQLADARQHAVLEIARMSGIDPEDLGVSTTSRTYANAETRRRDLLDFTLAAYMTAVQDRLSMGDVTRRGQYSRFNLDAFLRSDTLTRYTAYEIGKRAGAITGPEIRELEDKPPLTASQIDTTITPPTIQEIPVAASNLHLHAVRPAAAFNDGEPVIRLDSPQDAAAFSVDTEARTIKGLAVPYGKVGVSNGQRWQFSKGSLKFADVRRVKLWVQHDKLKAVGVATKLDDRDDGMYAEFSVARGAEGDMALSLAEDGVLDGLSIGLARGGKFSTRDGVAHAVEAPLMEVSLTPAPSFDDARVHGVAADATGGPDGQAVTVGQPEMIAISKAIAAGFATSPHNPQGGRETVSNSGLEVNEALPYRFDGAPAEHSFTADLRAMASGDSEARVRLDEFMEEAFAVTPANVAALNPTVNRPELYVPNLEYTRPLWSLVSNGTLTDQTPFTVPKFASAAGLVGQHTSGVEPTPGSFTATNQTITPAPVSGKIEILREVWDQGGSPQADAIIWREMVNGYYEAVEAKIAAMLQALTLTEINLAGAVDAPLVNSVQNVFIGLQFVRGGNRYTSLALDGNLFPALAAAADSTGRKLLPILGPTNAQGQVGGAFTTVSIGTQQGVPAWALGATNASNSYLFVPSSVWCWASPPKRFTFEYQVKSIDMAVWGYNASAVLRDTDVKRIDYTTSDV